MRIKTTLRLDAYADADTPGPPLETSEDVGTERKTPTCGVRYGAMNWLGEFRSHPSLELKCGSKVVIQTDRGIELGEQISLLCHDFPLRIPEEQVKRYIDNSGNEFYRYGAGRILREASPQDIKEHERLNLHMRSDIEICGKIAAETNLDMKVITAEHLLGGERIVFYFRAEGRVDFRELVRRLAQHYQTRIEMRQVGARDEARLIADYEICGRECCCKNFLKKLRPVTMRMAKLQKSTLDPSKVSGRCGRLRCCLRYEHEVYDDLLRRLPRVGTRVSTEFGPATVIDRQILTQLLLVRGDNDQTVAVPLEEVKLLDKDERLPEPEPETPDSRFEAEEAEELALASDNGNAAPPERNSGESSGKSRRRRRSRESRAPGGDRTPPPPDAAPPDRPPPPQADQTASKPDSGEVSGKSSSRRGRRRRRRPPRNNADGAS